MKKLLLISAIAIICGLVLITNVNAQKMSFKNNMEFKSRDIEKTRDGSNPNIVKRMPNTDNPEAIPGPKVKGGTDPGDCGCEVTFDNYSGYFVEIYFDGIYQATIGAWQKGVITANSGERKIYMATTGGSKEWVVETGTCKGQYTWKISK